MFSNRFILWCSKILPIEYDESLSYYELISKIYEYLNGVIGDIKKIDEIIKTYDIKLEEMQADVDYCKTEIEKIQNGEYTEQYINALSKWIDENLQAMVQRIVKYINFGLTNDGYFCAHIPTTWDFITFDTIADTSDSLYGHLLLEW
jgi:hypothetical protein